MDLAEGLETQRPSRPLRGSLVQKVHRQPSLAVGAGREGLSERLSEDTSDLGGELPQNRDEAPRATSASGVLSQRSRERCGSPTRVHAEAVSQPKSTKSETTYFAQRENTKVCKTSIFS